MPSDRTCAYREPVGAGHGHLEGSAGQVRLGRAARTLVVVLVAASGLAAVAGVLRWWPDGDRAGRAEGIVPAAATGVRVVHGELVDVRTACTGTGADTGVCGTSSARVLDGASAGRRATISLPPDVRGTGLRPGDRVLLYDLTGVPDSTGGGFEFYRADRSPTLLWLVILFGVVVVLVAWRRGVMALVSLGFAGLVVAGFLIPSLLSGQPAVPATLSAAVLILVVMLYATHGISMRTSVALLGAIVGVALSAAFAWFGIVGARLGGLGDDSAELITFNVHWVEVQQLIVASVIVAGLGTLNDVTVTQASALWELRSAAPTMSRVELFRRAMRIGRDHVASTVYTLVFAYLGTSLVLLLAVQLYRATPFDFVTAENVAEEVVRTLVGGIALVLAMPITTAIAALVVARESEQRPTGRRTTAGSGPIAAAAAPAVPVRRVPATGPVHGRPADPWSDDW